MLKFAAIATVLGFTFVASGSWAASIFDPIKVDSLTSPAPSQPWVPDTRLPSVPAVAGAQPAPGELGQPLSLAQLTDLALRLNPRTRQAWLSARAEAANIGIEHADDWPLITGAYSNTIGRRVSATSGAPSPVQTSYGPSISLNYVLYDFGQGDASLDAANYRLLAANLAQNRVLQEVVTQVEQAYYRVLAFEHLVRAARESLKNFETALDAALRRRASGLATAGDEYRAQTQVGQARLALTRNEGELAKSRGLLANAVGLPVNTALQLQPVLEAPPISEINQSMDALIEKAKANRPDLVASQARALAARANVLSVSRTGLPSLEFSANYGRLMFTNGTAVATDPLRNVQRAEQDTYAFGFSLKIPIFSGFKDTYSTRRAEEQAKQAESARDQLVNQTELEVWQSYFDFQTSVSSIASTANLVKSAGESAASAAARYKAGVGTLLDFITAQLDDTNAKVQQIQSYLDWYSALARLNFALGAGDSVVPKGTKAP